MFMLRFPADQEAEIVHYNQAGPIIRWEATCEGCGLEFSGTSVSGMLDLRAHATGMFGVDKCGAHR